MRDKQSMMTFLELSEDTSEGERIANALGDKQVLIMQNHGIFQQDLL